jgi:hypothetical protein
MAEYTIYGLPKKYTPSLKRIKQQTLKSVNLMLQLGTDEYGRISNPQVYYQAIEALMPYSSDIDIQTKMLQYENKALQLEHKIDLAQRSVYIFNLTTRGLLEDAYQTEFKDAKSVIKRVADTYTAAITDYQTDILGPARKDLEEKGIPIPSKVQTYWEKVLLKEAKPIIELNNTFQEGREIPYPGAYAVYMRTNPQTGTVLDIQIRVYDSIEADNTGFAKTQLKFAGIPIYLNKFFDNNGRVIGKIGDTILKWDKDAKLMKSPAITRFARGIEFETAGSRLLKLLQPERFPKEELPWEQNELSVDQFRYDPLEVPLGSIVKDYQDDYWFLDQEDELWEIGDEVDAELFLKATDRKENLAAITYPGTPELISEKLKFRPRKIVDRSILTGITTPARAAEPVSMIPAIKGKVYATKVAPETPEFTGKEYVIPKILGKGEKIFKTV